MKYLPQLIAADSSSPSKLEPLYFSCTVLQVELRGVMLSETSIMDYMGREGYLSGFSDA
jgi:hypothetical protein